MASDFTRIGANIPAMQSMNSFNSINNRIATHQLRLATGKRINTAGDDPAGYQLAKTLDSRSRGLNVALGKPIYVTRIDSKNNIITVDDEEGLYQKEFTTRNINLMMFDKLAKPLDVNVKIRYKDEGAPATIELINNDCI